ncbi:MAG: 6-hydroxynicotinate reductase [Rhodobacteraceae bacterium]|nr:6-hydroxynicotinate reductase [Paracoccaceae bacterium]
MCYIADGQSGACDRYANHSGQLVRLDPLTVIENVSSKGGQAVPFLSTDEECEWSGDIVGSERPFITAIGAGTTYPDYKPAPFIVSQDVDGVDMVTVVTEGIFSYCGVKVKIDTDRHVGEERAAVLAEDEPVGHVTTSEYGSKMLSLGGVEHLTGGSKKEGRVTCDTLLNLCNGEAVEMQVEDGANLVVQAGKAPVIDGERESLMRVGCGSAAIGMFARQWQPHVDEVIVVDDHITGVLTEHEAGKQLGMPLAGIRVTGRRSTPGRYFQVADAGTGWGGTSIKEPLDVVKRIDKRKAWSGLRLLLVSTTGEQWAYYVLDNELIPRPAQITEPLLETTERIAENCEPSICSVLFMGGAGGSLRAGVTDNPVRLTHSVRSALTYVSCGGAKAYIWPGGGITFMVDVLEMPANSFGYVPTPALVAPVEFTLRHSDFERLGGHVEAVQQLASILHPDIRTVAVGERSPDPVNRQNFSWARDASD